MGRSDGDARRAQLLDAALHAVSERGIVGLRIKDIAEAAGVATGTVHYHFKDLDDLLIAVHEEAIDRFVGARQEMIAALPDARDKIAALIDTGVPENDDDVLVVALYDLNALVRRSAVHRTMTRALTEQQVTLYATTVEIGTAQGHFSPSAAASDIAANAVALEDAYGLYIINAAGRFSADRARHLMRTHLAEALSCPAITIDPEESPA
ncbi:TetR/AcrR family transcriptional regulator [Demequina salsinemoris]|uniref:TetR/AcrR family transcriptional regulator n=1 Tax=Demequina salsinemoris TaxID=577470 RepID=UPI000782B790|nr:TetR family transcriptional regulator [Demequina salsinemoris]